MREQSIERVAFVFPGALGDFLLALPMLRLLRARHAGAAATLVVGGPLLALARLADVADASVSLDAAVTAGLFGGTALPPWLTSEATVYSWLGALDDDVRLRIGAVARRAIFRRVERGPGNEHAARAYARGVDVTVRGGILRAAAQLDVPRSPEADALCARLARPLLVVHAGAGAPRKRWAPAGFAAVAAWWHGRGGAVVELVGPAEAEGRAVPDAAVAAGWPLPDVAALLASSTLYLGNDSGVSHLAGAVGARGAVVFGPTKARRWRPVGGRLAALQTDATGDDGITLAAIPAARVVAACDRAARLTRTDPNISFARSNAFFAARTRAAPK